MCLLFLRFLWPSFEAAVVVVAVGLESVVGAVMVVVVVSVGLSVVLVVRSFGEVDFPLCDFFPVPATLRLARGATVGTESWVKPPSVLLLISPPTLSAVGRSFLEATDPFFRSSDEVAIGLRLLQNGRAASRDMISTVMLSVLPLA